MVLLLDLTFLAVQQGLDTVAQHPGLLHHAIDGAVKTPGFLRPFEHFVRLSPVSDVDVRPPFGGEEGDRVTVERKGLCDETFERLLGFRRVSRYFAS